MDFLVGVLNHGVEFVQWRQPWRSIRCRLNGKISHLLIIHGSTLHCLKSFGLPTERVRRLVVATALQVSLAAQIKHLRLALLDIRRSYGVPLLPL